MIEITDLKDHLLIMKRNAKNDVIYIIMYINVCVYTYMIENVLIIYMHTCRYEREFSPYLDTYVEPDIYN